MIYLTIALTAFTCGYWVRAIASDVHKVRAGLTAHRHPIPEPPSNVIPMRGDSA